MLAALFRLGRRIGVWPYIWVVHNGRAEGAVIYDCRLSIVDFRVEIASRCSQNGEWLIS